jgi:hypothetical protein
VSVESNRKDLFDVITGDVSMSSVGLSDSVIDEVLESKFYRPFVTDWNVLWEIARSRQAPGSQRGSFVWTPTTSLLRSIDAQQDRASDQYHISTSEGCDCEFCEGR